MIHPTKNKAEAPGHKGSTDENFRRLKHCTMKILTKDLHTIEDLRDYHVIKGPNYFIGDLHIGDQSIIDYYHRPFKDVQEERDVLLNNIFESMKQHYKINVIDNPYFLCILGDIGPKGREFINDIFRNAACVTSTEFYILLIQGNHDPNEWFNEPILSEDNYIYDTRIETSRYPVYANGMILSHEPLTYMPKESPYLNIHAHTHICDYGTGGKWLDGNRYFNVSCEKIGYKPISVYDIANQMEIFKYE